ncbi:tRNA lysidine(34) synthetase TilS [Enterococcus alishanensis]
MERNLKKLNPELFTAQKILVAVSTGVDSMVLLDLLEKLALPIGVAHVNHQLRAESEIEAVFLANYCREKKLPFYQTLWQQPVEKGMEAAARKFRYQFFADVMEKENYDLLVTAHHSDDQAETMLMRLVRGGSLQAHAGIQRIQPFTKGRLLRPLLNEPKESLISYGKENQLVYFEDASNQSEQYFRNRIRQKVVPLLKAENPQFLRHIQQFQQQLNDAETALKWGLKENLNNVKKTDQGWNFKLSDLPEISASRYYFLQFFFQMIAEDTNLLISQQQLQQMLALINDGPSQWSQDLGDDWQFRRSYQQFSLTPKQMIVTESFQIGLHQERKLSDGTCFNLRKKTQISAEKPNFQVFLPATTAFPLTIRKRQTGDRIQLTKDLRKKVSRYFIDQKISVDLREKAWLVEDANGEILAILPFVNSCLSNSLETDKILYILDYFD